MAARDEAAAITATLAALARAFPDARLWVADDGSRDATAALAEAAGATVAGEGAHRGKGAAMTAAARAALKAAGPGADECLFVLCDGDLGSSAVRLVALAQAVAGPPERIAVAAFARPRGGGFGIALGFARGAIRRRTGRRLRAPMSGQRALRGRALRGLLPFADGFGMELGIALDAHSAGVELVELELDLEHRARGRRPAAFVHRARQLADMFRAYRRR